MEKNTIWTRPFYYIIMFGVATVSLYPIFLMFMSSFKSSSEIFKNPLGLPTSFSLDTYRTLLNKIPFDQYFYNSVMVSVTSVVLVVLFCSLAAFYIARFDFSWNNAIFFLFLLGMMIPIKLGIVPLFILMRDLGLINSLWSLILMNIATGAPITMLILTGFLKRYRWNSRRRQGWMGLGTFVPFGMYFFHLCDLL